MERSFVKIPVTIGKAILSLPNDEAGQVFKSLMNYAETGKFEPLENDILNNVLLSLKSNVDEEKKRNEERSNKNRENVLKRWSKREESNYTTIPKESIRPYDDNDTTVYDRMKKRNGRGKDKGLCLLSRDYTEVRNLWNNVCISYSCITKLTSSNPKRTNRKKRIRECLEYIGERNNTTNIKQIKKALFDIFVMVEHSEKLKEMNRQKPCQVGFDWVMRVQNIKSILDGGFAISAVGGIPQQ